LDSRRTIISRRGMTIPKKRCFSSAAGGSSDNYKVTFKRFILESQYKDFPGLRDHIDELLAYAFIFTIDFKELEIFARALY
jgi:hypothetical protein